ncbi:hypothetical protein CONLIGDRAFT_668843 [Coniochaeta ligniaria NRRL 30616]|uniref:BRCT domain-containing protein n=1 Tax=Coniochaeta ligniaria NRRL 30616 TaxID=1408157 RepID=A0A1J7ITH6_9PEZI|nr:hypothetical protein CONLIGDRAFT_668843 [Coniochaeta ligniaria NRRL 30616]
MLVSLTVGKVDAGVTVLLTPDKRLIEFPSILLPPDISSGSIVDITVSRNTASETAAELSFRRLQDQIYASFGADRPLAPQLRCRNATQTSVVLEWDPIHLATADLVGLALFRNNQKAGNIPRPLAMHSTKISGLAVDTEYVFHLVLRTTAGTYTSDKVAVRTHKMTDLSGITITTGIMPGATREALSQAVERIGAKVVEGVRIDTTHFVTTEGRGVQWEKAVEMNIPVVRPEWVEACEKNGRILGVTKFYLDAVRPPVDERPTAPQTQKELPEQPKVETPVAESSAPALVAPQSGEVSAAQRKEEGGRSDEDEESSSSEEESEAADKVLRPSVDEQKVRADERDAQGLAARPKPTVEDEDDQDDDEDDNNEEKPPAAEKGTRSPEEQRRITDDRLKRVHAEVAKQEREIGLARRWAEANKAKKEADRAIKRAAAVAKQARQIELARQWVEADRAKKEADRAKERQIELARQWDEADRAKKEADRAVKRAAERARLERENELIGQSIQDLIVGGAWRRDGVRMNLLMDRRLEIHELLEEM